VVGGGDGGRREEIVTLLCALLARIPRVRLILPVSIGSVLTDADVARISEIGTDTAELILVDEVADKELDIAIGVNADPMKICRTVEYSVPILTADAFVGRYAAGILRAAGLGLEIAPDTAELAACAASLLHDVERLSYLHETLRWNLLDSPVSEASAYMFTMERAYDRLAETVRKSLDMEKLRAIVGMGADA